MMSGLDSVKAERFLPSRDACLQRLREKKRSVAQRRSANASAPTFKQSEESTPLAPEVFTTSEVKEESDPLRPETVQEPEVGSQHADNSSFSELPIDPPQSEPKKRKDLDDARRRTIIVETELQNGDLHLERLKVKLLEEDNEKLRAALKHAQKVRLRQASTVSESVQSEIKKLTSVVDDKVRTIQTQELQLLSAELQRTRSEKAKLKESIDNYVVQLNRYKESSEAHIKMLEHEKEALLERVRKTRSEQSVRGDEKFAEYAKEKEGLYKQLSESRELAEDLSQSVRERDERIVLLERQLDEMQAVAHEESNKALSAMYQHGSIPEPPPEQFSPILDMHPSGHKTRPLVADVGSTGTSAVRHHTEEFKELNHYASPAPQEPHYQSTGETLHDPRLYDTGAATPPMEQPWVDTSIHSHTNSESRTPPITQRSMDFDPGYSSSEEEKERSLGTPKRDEALSGHNSRSSTPPRQRYSEKSSTPQPQQNPNQRVHNLTQPNYPMHYSIPAPTAELSRPSDQETDDFFTQIQQENEQRRRHFDSAI